MFLAAAWGAASWSLTPVLNPGTTDPPPEWDPAPDFDLTALVELRRDVVPDPAAPTLDPGPVDLTPGTDGSVPIPFAWRNPWKVGLLQFAGVANPTLVPPGMASLTSYPSWTRLGGSGEYPRGWASCWPWHRKYRMNFERVAPLPVSMGATSLVGTIM